MQENDSFENKGKNEPVKEYSENGNNPIIESHKEITKKGKSKILIKILELICSVIFWNLAFYLDSRGMLVWSVFFVFAAIITSLILLYTIVIPHIRYARVAKCIFIIIGVVIFAIAYQCICKAVEDISVSYTKKFTSINRKEKPHFWLVQNEKLHPIHIAFEIIFKNLKPKPFMIRSYFIETEIKPNEWKSLRRIDVRLGDLYLSDQSPTGHENVLQVSLVGVDLFDQSIEDKTIEPNEPIRGMVFLELPKSGIGEKWRFRAEDTDGNESVTFLTAIDTKTISIPPVQRTGFKIISDRRDLSIFEPQFYNDR